MQQICKLWVVVTGAGERRGAPTGAPTCCSGSSLSCIRTCFWEGHEVMMRMEGGWWKEGTRWTPEDNLTWLVLHFIQSPCSGMPHSHSLLIFLVLLETEGVTRFIDWTHSNRSAAASNPPCSSPLAWLLVCMEDARWMSLKTEKHVWLVSPSIWY